MPAQEYINVRVYVDGQPLNEYPNPEGEAEDDHHMTRYVEVKAGQRFSVKVALLPGFKFLTASYICVKLFVDQNKNGVFHTCSYESVTARRGELQLPRVFWFDQHTIRDEVTGQWVNACYEFGPLGVDGDAPLPENLSPPDIELLGSLRVSVYRAKAKLVPNPYVWDGAFTKPLDEISEKALKGKPIKNNVKYAVKGVARPPAIQHYQYTPINSDRGAPHEFKFLYRTRGEKCTTFMAYELRSTGTLQSLGCIPRSPSPVPDAGLMMRRNNEMMLAMHQELRELRERVARAESGNGVGSEFGRESTASTLAPRREPRVKVEPLMDNKNPFRRPTRVKTDTRSSVPLPPLPAHIKQENRRLPERTDPGSGAKRPRDEATLDDGDEPVEVLPPPRRTKVIIDLTDD